MTSSETSSKTSSKTSSETSDIDIKLEDGVQTIRFMRAGKKNALTRSMYEAMSAALDDGEGNDDLAVHLFIGSGGSFTAGNDLKDFIAHVQSGAETLPALDFVRRLPKVTKPMIAAVDGMAVGIGTTLLLHCDLVYASPAARLSTPFLDLALVPEAGSALLAQRMGYQRAFELLCLGDIFDAERALLAGLVNKIVPADELEAGAMAVARRLVAKPREALLAARALMRGNDLATICNKIEEEALVFAARLESAEAMEAFAAFFEKRKPDFAKLKR